MKRLILFIAIIATLIFSAFSASASSSVMLVWNPSVSPQVIGYKIYDGVRSGVYTNIIDVGNVTNTVVSNLVSGVTYYFAATAYAPIVYDTNFIGNTNSLVESPFSNETSYSVPFYKSTYLGIKLDYGTNIISLTSIPIMVLIITNDPGYFYSESLIITNNPFVGIKPSDTNKYVYIGTALNYGTNIFNITRSTFPVKTFTNPPPNQAYRGSLIVTNRPF